MADEQQQAEEILVALNDAIKPKKAFDIDDVPAGRTAAHVTVALSRRYVPGHRSSGEIGVTGGRLVTRYIADNLEDARTMRTRVTGALEGVMIPCDGDYLGPFTFESGEPVGDDDRAYSGYDTWTF